MDASNSAVLGVAVSLLIFAPARGQDSKEAFDRDLAPLLARHCLECHSGVAKGGLDLTSRAGVLKGGESGAAAVPGNAKESLLWERIVADEMPPKSPLSKPEKEQLRRWIDAGLVWGTEPIDRLRFTTNRRAGTDWWSFQPVRPISPPEIGDTTWPRTPIDEFVWRRLSEAGLHPSDAADPRTLIRRVYFDLTGLPPASEVIEDFVADPSDDAYRDIVDSLLESDAYGERWGRHWLDIVRFGESNGFERNGPRYNFWHYRDWVIDALNQDMPYDEFVRLQLIGDMERPGREGTAAIGFLVAGVHNTVVGGSERMKKLALQDELEEVIGTIGQTFLGLTVNCSRCHDHKFDPIRQQEYYRLIATISGMRHGERAVRSDKDERRLRELVKREAELTKQLAAIDDEARKGILQLRKEGKAKAAEPPKPIARWDFEGDFRDTIGSLHGKPFAGAKIENGALVVDGKSYVETAPIPVALREKTLEAWVQLHTLDQGGGGAISIETHNGLIFDAIVFAERERRQWMAGSNGFVRTDPFGGPTEEEAASRPVHFAIVYETDGTIRGYRDGKPYGKAIRKSGLQAYDANSAHIAFGIRHKPAGSNKHLRANILQARLYDRALPPDAVAASAGEENDYVPEAQIVAWLSDDARNHRADLKKEVVEVRSASQKLRTSTERKIYTMTAAQPSMIRFLERGDIEREGDVVTPGAIAAVQGVNAEFGLAENSSDSERRRKLAEWITSPGNPLFPRVIVNRLWQYHFGAGFVLTPSDFGFNGGRPSHPGLIDWLAGELKRHDYRLKPLHRLIVTSATYRQSSRRRPDAERIDTDNRLLWRVSPRRLEAEAVRDAMLQVAGQLNPQMGGPGYIDVTVTPNNGTTYYEAKDVDGAAFFRRTIYRFTPRGGRSALLDTFDCPDPATTAPRRAVTTTPLQALSLLNNAFVLRMSNYFAQRVQSDVGDDVQRQVDRAWQTALGREPDAIERRASLSLVVDHGLPALCRGLFNASEFVVLD